jgi:hypothetical protein
MPEERRGKSMQKQETRGARRDSNKQEGSQRSGRREGNRGSGRRGGQKSQREPR